MLSSYRFNTVDYLFIAENMNVFLLPLIIFIGTARDLRITPFIAFDAQARFRFIIDPQAPKRFGKLTGQAYRARWAGRVFRIHKGLPHAYVVLGRESVNRPRGGMGNNGCINGAVTICEADKPAECADAVRGVWCE